MENESDLEKTKRFLLKYLHFTTILFLASIAIVIIFASTFGALQVTEARNNSAGWEMILAGTMALGYILLNIYALKGMDDPDPGLFFSGLIGLIMIPIFSMILCGLGLYAWILLSAFLSEESAKTGFQILANGIHWNLAPRVIGFYTIIGVIIDLGKIFVIRILLREPLKQKTKEME